MFTLDYIEKGLNLKGVIAENIVNIADANQLCNMKKCAKYVILIYNQIKIRRC
jgi:hypothetical protein